MDAKPVYVSDSVSFHEAVLKAFVTTFHFDGQPLITALRMFLAAFRLPGEAQQIDRVLQAFANVRPPLPRPLLRRLRVSQLHCNVCVDVDGVRGVRRVGVGHHRLG